MEEYTQITLTEWMSWKEDIRQKLQETAGNFVHIGFRLKQIRNSGMYDGAADVFEFAQKEYGLSKSTVSRFIAINEKFSEGGNSLELREEYRNIGSSKLSEMLTLPDADCTLITEKTTVREIRELKEFNRQEVPEEYLESETKEQPENCCDVATEMPGDIVNIVSEDNSEDIEEREQQEEDNRFCQQQNTDQEHPVSYTPLQKCIIDFFKNEEKKESLIKAMEMLMATEERLKEAADIVNPGSYCTHRKGLVFLFMYDWQQGVKYKVMGALEPVSMTWTEFLREIQEIYLNAYSENPENVWEEFYGSGEKTEQQAEKQEQNVGKPEPITEKDKSITEKPETITKKGEEDGTEERTGDSEGTGEEPEGQQDTRGQEAEAAPEGETNPAGDGEPAEEPETCCDVATEIQGAIVSTEAELDSAAVEDQVQQEEKQREKMSEYERRLREEAEHSLFLIRRKLELTSDMPITMSEAREAHAAGRNLLAILDRIYNIKEKEQDEIEGQMSLEDMEEDYVSE